MRTPATALGALLLWIGSAAAPAQIFERCPANPLLDARKLGLDNIMFPCVIRVPPWVRQRKGEFYMYYAAHSGKSIFVAAADRPEGPWKPLPNPVLTIDRTPFPNHISSPDVLEIAEQKRFYLYFHGAYLDVPEFGFKSAQPSSVAVSEDPLEFPRTQVVIATRGVNFAYFRVFRKDECFYAVGRQGRLFRSIDGLRWEAGPYLLNWDRFADLTKEYPDVLSRRELTYRIAHVGLLAHCEDEILDCYFSLRADAGISLQKVRISLHGHWKGWAPVETPVTVLTPAESLDFPPNGIADIRDPVVLAEGGYLYLYYVAGSEKYICLARSKAEASRRSR